MDSLTQIILGASTAEAVIGKKVGNKALLIGGIAGTIPDLDVLANPFLSDVTELVFHRSFSHSLLFVVFGGWLFAYLTMKLWKWQKLKFQDLFLTFSLCFLTHILLDTCTTWGTQLLWPFTSYGYALYNVFVIDPFYTLPFLLLLIAILFINRTNAWRSRLNWIALGVSSSYLILGLILQQKAEQVFQESMATQGIEAEDMITKTTPLNIILWTCSIKTKQGYYTGYYSFFDEEDTVKFDFDPSNADLLKPYYDHPDIQTLISVTKGYYTVDSTAEGLVMNDLRFGKFNGWQGEEQGEYVFKYAIQPQENGDLMVEMINYREAPDGDYFRDYFGRIKGRRLRIE